MNENSMTIFPGVGITLTEPLTISIDKEYFEERFKHVFGKWEEDLKKGIGKELQELLLLDLIDCFNV